MIMIIKIKILVAGSSVDGSCIWTATVREERCYGVDGSHLIIIVMIHYICRIPSFKSSSLSCFMQLRLLYQFFIITCLPSTVRPRVLCINLLKIKGEKQLCQAQCASPLV